MKIVRTTITCILSVAAFLYLQGCSNDETVFDPPSLYSISPNKAGMGDTVVITGEGFLPDARMNTVVFSPCSFSNSHSGMVSIPFSATSTSLSVIVPDGAFDGGVRAQWSNPVGNANPFGIEMPPIPSNALDFKVRMDVGDVAKIFYSDARYDFSISTEASQRQYMMILFNSADPPTPSRTYDYELFTQTACGPLNTESRIPGEAAADKERMLPTALQPQGGKRARDFRRRIRREYIDLLDSGGRFGNDNPRIERQGALRADGHSLSDPLTAGFDVYSDPDGSPSDPASFTSVTAELKYEGDHTLLYVDQSTDAACITDLEAEALGLAFESGIYQTDRGAFGSESDINHDGKVAILLSPVINRMTPPGTAQTEGYIAGFFLPGDLVPAYLNPGCTNGMEIFYTMVPDPSGIYGNIYEKIRALDVIEGVLAHEFEHMIMFNYRILIYGQGVQAFYVEDLWIEEGLAHIAEDLNGYKESNIIRADLFLADPGNVTLIHGGDELDERGASFLFMRYLGDRFGNDIYRSIVQTKHVGTSNIENATGLSFYEIFSDWAATCCLEALGLEYDERFRYTSIDLRADFYPLRIIDGAYCAGVISGDVKSMAPEYITLDFSQDVSIDFTVESDYLGRMNAIIIRLQ